MLQKIQFKIHGMHCTSCEILIEQRLKKIDGVQNVHIKHHNGIATLECSRIPSIDELQKAITHEDYRITGLKETNPFESQRPKKIVDYIELGAIFTIVTAIYIVLKQLNIIPDVGITEGMGYGIVFLIGLVAAFSSCLAVTGGLLLGITATYTTKHPNLTSAQKFKPSLYFNIGRLLSYTVLGGVIGAIGSAIAISPRMNSAMIIFASGVMILLGFHLLQIFPHFTKFQPRMPKFIGRWVMSLDHHNKGAAFILGGLTFFLPCGFTQALQLYVLSQASATQGALTMLVFALGTLPTLLVVGFVTSTVKGEWYKYFIKFAGVTTVFLGITTMNSGLALSGVGITDVPNTTTNSTATVEIKNNVQIVNMKVVGLNYTPSQFLVKKGIPVEWHIDGRLARGCARLMMAQKVGVQALLQNDAETVVRFTPETIGTIPFSCPMGMTTRGAKFVVQ